MRVLTLALMSVAWPVAAETFTAAAPVAAAVLFPDGAAVTRRTTLDMPAGAHRLVLAGLPAGTDPAVLRVAVEGARLGGVTLDATPPLEPVESAAAAEARVRVERLEAELRRIDATVAAITARAEAAEAEIAFLRDLAGTEGQGAAALLAEVQARVLAARLEAIAARREAADASVGRAALAERLDRARAAWEAVRDTGDTVAVVLRLDAAGGPVTVAATALTDAAGWAPVYDARLDRVARTLSVERAARVRQETGGDWEGVALTLSTARPAEGGQPSELWPEIVRLGDPAERLAARSMATADMAAPAAAPVMEAVEAATPRFEGLSLAFDAPAPVDLRSGAEELRVALGPVAVAQVAIRAEAVPRLDSRATLVAEAVNGAEVLLPGTVSLHEGGAMVGQAELPLVAAGDELRLGFGPIDALTVERRTLAAEAGDRGLIARRQTETERVQIVVRNLSAEAWPLRLTDRVPVSEAEDLTVAWTADPAPTATDPDGARGLLVWDLDLAAGATQEITLETTLTWPEGRFLLR